MKIHFFQRLIRELLLALTILFMSVPVWALDPAMVVGGLVAAGSPLVWNLGYRIGDWWNGIPPKDEEEAEGSLNGQLGPITPLVPEKNSNSWTPSSPSTNPQVPTVPDLSGSVTKGLLWKSNLSPEQQTALNSTRYLDLSSGQSTFNQYSDLRQTLNFYRIGSVFDERWRGFVRAYGSHSDYGRMPGIAGMNSRMAGLSAGVWSESRENRVVGVMLGTRKTSARFHRILGSGTLETVHLGPFVSWQKAGWKVDGVLSMGLNQYTNRYSDRSTEAVKTGQQGHDWSAYGALGYDVELDQWVSGLTATPTLEMMYMYSEAGSYRERRQDNNSLRIARQSSDQWLMRAVTDFNLLRIQNKNPALFRLSVGWQQQYMNAGKIRVGSDQPPGTYYYHAPAISDSGLYLGLTYQQKLPENTTIALQYMAINGSKSQTDGLQFSFERKF